MGDEPTVSGIIASKRLMEQKSDWVRTAPNHLLTVTVKPEAAVELISVERRMKDG